MRTIDDAMAEALRKAVARWADQVRRVKELCAREEEEIAYAELDLKACVVEINEITANINTNNTDEKVQINTYSTKTSRRTMATIQRAFSRKRETGAMEISEPFAGFVVTWNGGVDGAEWLNPRFDYVAKTWHCPYIISRRGAELTATSYVARRVFHKKSIDAWVEKVAHLKGTLPDRRRGIEDRKAQLNRNREEERLLESNEGRAQAVLAWADELGRAELAANKKFDEVERKRYSMPPEEVPVGVLFDFIEAQGRGDLVEPARAILGNPPAGNILQLRHLPTSTE
jgi:hypothetical protein